MVNIEQAERQWKSELGIANALKLEAKNLPIEEQRKAIIEAWKIENRACEDYQKAIREAMNQQRLCPWLSADDETDMENT